MRTVRIKVYKFDELKTEKARQKAIDWYREGQLDYEWWDFIYDDAETIGLKITGFDLGRANYVNGELMEYAHIVAGKIMTEHGDQTETYKTATKYLADLKAVEDKLPVIDDGEGHDTNESDRDEQTEELADEFKKSLLADYLVILRNEYEYLTSDEQIIESLQSNDYEFTLDGDRARY